MLAHSQCQPLTHTWYWIPIQLLSKTWIITPLQLLATAEGASLGVSFMSLEWQSPTPCLGSVTQSRVFSSSESVCRCYIIIVSSHAARTTQVEDSDSDDGQHDMDSDDVGQPEINYSVLYYPLFLSLPLSFPPSLPSLPPIPLSLPPSLPFSLSFPPGGGLWQWWWDGGRWWRYVCGWGSWLTGQVSQPLPSASIAILPCLFSDTEEVSGDVGITDDKKVILERVRMNTRKEYLEGGGTSSVRATDRLMRELQDIYRSRSHKDGKKL